MVEMVLSDYGATLSGEIADRKLEYPLIQYRETDFVFFGSRGQRLWTDDLHAGKERAVFACGGSGDGGFQSNDIR